MNSNMFVKKFGLNPDDFEITNETPLDWNHGYIIDLTQKVTNEKRVYPKCGSTKCYSKRYYNGNYIDYSPDDGKYVFNIKRQRLKCSVCGLSFTPELKGLILIQSLQRILKEKLQKN